MSIFISHTSALECLRADIVPRGRSLSRAKPSPENIPTYSLVSALDFTAFGIEALPVHLAVSNASSRGYSQSVTCHIWQGPRSARSFGVVGEDLYASGAEACFLQLATMLPPIELAQVGCEFCGTYALDSHDPHGFRKRKPLTSIRALERYLSKAEGIHGIKSARQALRFVVEGSASPMETIVTLLLCLPNVYGGYGLEPPSLNHSIPMPDEVRAATGRKQCICDLFWPEARLAVEYESDQWHAGPEHIARDSKRRTALELAGVMVVTVTRAQIYDARALNETAHVLANRMEKRLRIQCSNWLSKRFELRARLLQPRTLS